MIEEVGQNGNILAHSSQGQGIDEPLSELRSGVVSFYEQDGLRSVTSLSSIGGALRNVYSYDSFGNVISSSGSTVNPHQYTGRDYDPETALLYYRARYYDQSTARFLNQDRTAFASGINFYTYADNDPADLLDPSGLFPLYPGRLGCPKNCEKVTPSDLRYDIPRVKGKIVETADDHITNNHINPKPGKSRYMTDPPSTSTIMLDKVKGYNALTFTNGFFLCRTN